jgi:hypothetical protein
MSRRLAIFALTAAFGAAHCVAQSPVGTTETSVAISGITQTGTDLDAGGRFHWGGGIASASIARQFTPQFNAGLSVQYSYEEWKFNSDNVAFGGQSPWSNLSRPVLGVDLTYAATEDLVFSLSPTFGWSYDTKANASDGQVYGALLTATKVFSPTLVLGLGAGVFRDVEKTRAFPFLIVDWKIDDRWSVTNPFPAGPAGGAGLELVYAWNERWQIAGGATYRSYRYRLAHDSPYPDGIGESRSIPVFARLTHKFGKASRVDFYAGVLLDGKLTVENAGGSEVASDQYQAAPVLGLTLASRF